MPGAAASLRRANEKIFRFADTTLFGLHPLRVADTNPPAFCRRGALPQPPPEWTDSVDPASGAVYYTHSETGETQWERPFDFVPIVREELYSTPQARFIKSILSPKRSHHNMNHAMPGMGLPRV